MAEWQAAAIAAGQGILGSAFANWQNDKQREWQEEMSNSSHQREVKDLRAAGLNPILSARLGGASTPPGASSLASTPDISAAMSNASQATTASKRQQAELMVMAASANQANSAAGLSQAQTADINNTQVDRVNLLIAQAEAQQASGKLSDEQRKKVQHEINKLRQEKALLENQTKASALGVQRDQVKTIPYQEIQKVIPKVQKKFEETKKSIQDFGKERRQFKSSKEGLEWLKRR